MGNGPARQHGHFPQTPFFIGYRTLADFRLADRSGRYQKAQIEWSQLIEPGQHGSTFQLIPQLEFRSNSSSGLL